MTKIDEAAPESASSSSPASPGSIRYTHLNPGGRPKIIRPCPYGCGRQLGAREMQIHKVGCLANPKSKP